MIFRLSSLALLLACSFHSFAQTIDNRIAPTRRPLSEVEQVVMPAVDNEALRAAEMERRGPGVAPRFAESFEVDIRPETHGTWEKVSNGKEVWRLRLRSDEAYSLNLGFTEYYMPPGGTLILYSPNQKHVMGPFSPADNEVHQELWTPIFEGEELVVEVQLPAEKRASLRLRLTSVNHDFLGFNSVASGSCNLDVICGLADGWEIVDAYRDIIQSVAVYGFGGNTFCTGFLINNARNDCTPYFMTAAHCGVNTGNAPSLVVYWNYENSTCRQPNSPASGGPGDGVLTDFNSGAEFRAGYSPSDFTLVELDDPVSETADAFFAGWYNGTAAPTDTTICIHHPSTDEKRISFEFDPTFVSNYLGENPNPNGNHITVEDWDIGTTEGGSSGSPLFNKKKQVVGQLHGGFAACGNDDLDSYGWFHTSWTGGGTPSTSLAAWLDPDNTGISELDGQWQQGCGYFVDPLIPSVSVCAPDAVVYTLAVSDNFEDEVTMTLTDLPDGAEAVFEANPAMPGDTITLTIQNTAAVGPGDFTVILNSTDGVNTSQSSLFFSLADGIPSSIVLLTPVDGEMAAATFPFFSWEGQDGGTIYDLEVAADPDFNTIVGTAVDLGDNQDNSIQLNPSTTYYWRVRGSNVCGQGDWSEPFSFTTSAIFCGNPIETTVPVTISGGAPSTATSTLEINAAGAVASIRVVDLDISHSWVGDLIIELTAPNGNTVTLVDRPGVPASTFGCSSDNLFLTFDDNSPNIALDLENTCQSGSPAISGTFQPVELLANLGGVNINGTWTLSVIDNESGDGGIINSWGLEICANLPSDASLSLLTGDISICEGEPFTFDLVVGSGFPGEVTLAASGLPAGAQVSYSANPTPPGSVVTVTVANIAEDGQYTLDFTASAGPNTDSGSVLVDVAPFPGIPQLLVPANGQTGTPLSVFLDWAVASNSQGYTLTVATNPALTDIVVMQNIGISNYTLAGLDYQTTYYWQVIANNDCGPSPSPVFSFTTLADLTLSAGPASQTVCSFENPVYTLQVGQGFAGTASISYAVSPQAGLDFDFNVDPAAVPPGAEVTATATDLAGIDPGSYTITFEITDGNSTVAASVDLTIEAQPAVPALVEPAADVVLMTDAPQFVWEAADAADDYRLEIATDPQFTNIVRSIVVSETNYTIEDPLSAGDYFWRVTALNNCGGSTSGQRALRIEPSATDELAGQRVFFEPNPTTGLLNIRLNAPLPGRIAVEVFALNGQLLRQAQFAPAGTRLVLDLSDQPSGLYLVRLRHETAALHRRVVVQR